MAAKMSAADAKAFVDELYRKVAKRWEERVTRSRFMQEPHVLNERGIDG
jgi:hypothetical protein